MATSTTQLSGHFLLICLGIFFCNLHHCSGENATDTSKYILPVTEIKGYDPYGKSFYTHLGNDGMSYFEAIHFCYDNKLVPAILTSPRDDEILLKYLLSLSGTEYNSRPFWLTLNDIEIEGKFIWRAFEPLGAYKNWAPSSPIINQPAVNCVSAQQLSYEGSSQKFGWINLPCSTKWRPLCQGIGGWQKSSEKTDA